MVHICRPDQYNGFQWMVYVEDRHAAETIRRYFDTEAEATAQAKIWDDEMQRTGIVIGARSASYER